jgi:hypothetical protein
MSFAFSVRIICKYQGEASFTCFPLKMPHLNLKRHIKNALIYSRGIVILTVIYTYGARALIVRYAHGHGAHAFSAGLIGCYEGDCIDAAGQSREIERVAAIRAKRAEPWPSPFA